MADGMSLLDGNINNINFGSHILRRILFKCMDIIIVDNKAAIWYVKSSRLQSTTSAVALGLQRADEVDKVCLFRNIGAYQAAYRPSSGICRVLSKCLFAFNLQNYGIRLMISVSNDSHERFRGGPVLIYKLQYTIYISSQYIQHLSPFISNKTFTHGTFDLVSNWPS